MVEAFGMTLMAVGIIWAAWVVLWLVEQQTFYGRTLEEALARRLVWLMAPELGIGPFDD